MRLDLSPRSLLSLAAAFGGLIALGWGIGELIDGPLKDAVLQGLDRPISLFLVEHRTTWMTSLMEWATWLGAAQFMAVALLASLLLLYRPQASPALAAFVVLAVLAATGLDDVIKGLVGRDRPALSQVTAFSGSAFPSGHASAAASIFASFAIALSVGRPRRTSVYIWSAASLGALLVALSRVYLGAHWTTDVVAGVALGAAWPVLVARLLGVSSRGGR